MHIDWGTLAAIAATAAATTVVVVLLVSFAVLGLSARSGRRVREPGDSGAATQPAAAGVALASVCLLAAGLIVGYGLYLIIA